MSECIFCQIVANKIPSFRIFETEDYVAFLDITQITDGHTLIIPKEHVRWVWEVENIGAYFAVVKKVALHFQKVTGKEMVMSVVMGEMVEHAHVHLLPQTEGSLEMVMDGWERAMKAREFDRERLERMREKFGLMP